MIIISPRYRDGELVDLWYLDKMAAMNMEVFNL